MSRNLPDYEQPPVGEVVLSLQFETIELLDVAQLGLLWNKYRERFPKASRKQPLDPVIEEFHPPCAPVLSGPRLIISDDLPVPRLWFRSENDSELIQVQQDRFLRNWIRTEDNVYPRYKSVKADFFSDLDRFESFLAEEDLGEIKATQCEVTYINYIYQDQNKWDLGGVLSVFDSTPESRNLEIPETAQLKLRYLIEDAKQQKVGRLHVNAYSACNRTSKEQLVRVDLTARGIVSDHDDWKENVSDFMDIGRNMIVKSFTELTSDSMHELWGRFQ